MSQDEFAGLHSATMDMIAEFCAQASCDGLPVKVSVRQASEHNASFVVLSTLNDSRSVWLIQPAVTALELMDAANLVMSYVDYLRKRFPFLKF